jgi:hypothetical protein
VRDRLNAFVERDEIAWELTMGLAIIHVAVGFTTSMHVSEVVETRKADASWRRPSSGTGQGVSCSRSCSHS